MSVIRQVICATALAVSACCSAAPQLELPARAADLPGASAIVADITSMTVADREQRIYSEIARGNVPSFVREFHPINVSAETSGTTHNATYLVTPDYMAIGSDTDYLRIPMTPILAQRVADLAKCSLITRKMSNDIYRQAEVKLAPQPIPPSPLMGTVPVFVQHNRMIEDERTSAGAQLRKLIAGIKKDVVITPLLALRPPPPRVAIYGWHKLDGTAIQPLSLVHQATYADYSHGIRLVSNTMTVDGQTTTAQSVMSSPALCALLSDEGVQTVLRYPQ